MTKCHGCETLLPQDGGCKNQVLICQECRVKPKKLEAARKAHSIHMLHHTRIDFTERRMQRVGKSKNS